MLLIGEYYIHESRNDLKSFWIYSTIFFPPPIVCMRIALSPTRRENKTKYLFGISQSLILFLSINLIITVAPCSINTIEYQRNCVNSDIIFHSYVFLPQISWRLYWYRIVIVIIVNPSFQNTRTFPTRLSIFAITFLQLQIVWDYKMC